ncbi:MAG: 4-alpha-glucanotransferase [Candidatus Sumerlaeia bacterium]|nr:4-alpha-glucanotransferase [Candidatus Sumerlaeia bacterium]
MVFERRYAGVLLHPTSLPGPFGIGDFGPAAFRFLDWMRGAGLRYWQVLPLGPTSYGDSPYQCFSSCAGSPYMISPELLVRDGLLHEKEILPPAFPTERVDYGWVIDWKKKILKLATDRFAAGGFSEMRGRYNQFLKAKEIAWWLDDFAMFMALKDHNEGRSWDNWDKDLRGYKAAALKSAATKFAAEIEGYRIQQFLFFEQWGAVRRGAAARGIEVIGDAPIYVAYDSADAWANQEFFQLDKKTGLPTAVAGVPPDYFSATGQLWGNPLYNWEKLEAAKFKWWIDRIKSTLAMVDYLRLDHFRGFGGYWSVPFGHPTAEHGTWVEGPGAAFFAALKRGLGNRLPIIAEDLGEITSDVHEMRAKFELPGMKILQFAWSPASVEPLVSNPNSGFLPHQIDANQVVYTGSHDNDTTVGWYTSATPAERHLFRSYLSTDGSLPHWDLIRSAFRCHANTAIIQMQDFLGLPTDCRMNLPGTSGVHNWSWRLLPTQIDQRLAETIRGLALLYERHAEPPAAARRHPAIDPNYS